MWDKRSDLLSHTLFVGKFLGISDWRYASAAFAEIPECGGNGLRRNLEFGARQDFCIFRQNCRSDYRRNSAVRYSPDDFAGRRIVMLGNVRGYDDVRVDDGKFHDDIL